MIFRVLACLLVACATLRAEGPGVMIEGSAAPESNLSGIAQDADGTVWATSGDSGKGVSILSGQRWEQRFVPGLDDRCHAVATEKLANGDVGTLWQDISGGADAWVLARHRGDKSRVAVRFNAMLREPTMHGLADGRIIITESGRTFVIIPPGD